MRCPNCSYNQRATAGQVCGQCQYHFTFNPKTDGMTDGRWLALINSVSGSGTYHFTANQLFATHCRKSGTSSSVVFRLAATTGITGFVVQLVLGIVIGLVLAFWASYMELAAGITDPNSSFRFWQTVLLILLGWLLVRNNFNLGVKNAVDHQAFAHQMARWEADHPSEKLLTEPTLHEPPPEWSEGDIYDYGVEGLLIVDEDRLVDLLVLNGFHAEQRCAVISKTGYPSYDVPHIKKSLNGRIDVPVFVLHSATIEGRMLPYIVKDLDLGVTDHPIIDLGWSSGDFLQVSKLQLFDVDNWEGATKVDILPPRQLHGLLSSAMRERVPLSAFMGREEAAGAWTLGGDRVWVDVSDYG